MQSCFDLLWNVILLIGFLACAAMIIAIAFTLLSAGASLLAILGGPMLVLLLLGLLTCALTRGG